MAIIAPIRPADDPRSAPALIPAPLPSSDAAQVLAARVCAWTPPELWRGWLDGEDEPERAARLAAADDILADLAEEVAREADQAGLVLAAPAPEPDLVLDDDFDDEFVLGEVA